MSTPGTGPRTRVLVTGAGRGIGKAIALAFADPGNLVAIAARTGPELDQTARSIEAHGAVAVPIVTDVADEGAVARMGDQLRRASSGIDVVVNNAGMGGGQRVDRTDTASWRRIVDTNLLGTFLVTRQVIPLMADGGRIINMSSVLGRFGVAGYTAYCASKHGIIGFTRALALELAARRITANVICPGWVETEMAAEGMQNGANAMGLTYEQFREQALRAVPIGRIIQPEEVASLVKFLVSPAAAAITGQAYNICGGQTMD